MCNQPTNQQPPIEPGAWLLESYKTLCDQYKHEDIQFLATTTLFLTIQGAMLAFIASSVSESHKTPAYLTGLVMCIPWFVALFRSQTYRSYFDQEIIAAERQIEAYPSLPKRFSRINFPSYESQYSMFFRMLRKCKWAYVMMTIPGFFALVWTLLLFMPSAKTEPFVMPGKWRQEFAVALAKARAEAHMIPKEAARQITINGYPVDVRTYEKWETSAESIPVDAIPSITAALGKEPFAEFLRGTKKASP